MEKKKMPSPTPFMNWRMRKTRRRMMMTLKMTTPTYAQRRGGADPCNLKATGAVPEPTRRVTGPKKR